MSTARAFESERDTLLDFVGWLVAQPSAQADLFTDPDEARHTINRFLADHGIACDDYAPDTLAPDPSDRDICTTCYYRGMDHGAGEYPQPDGGLAAQWAAMEGSGNNGVIEHG